jgi:hypothetical protein
LPGLEVYSKTGTWGPIFADAGIIRDGSGRQLVVVVFIEASPPYRGSFIADLAYRSAAHLLRPAASPESGPASVSGERLKNAEASR